MEGADVRDGDKAVEGACGDAIEEDVVEAVDDNGDNDNLSTSEGDKEEGEDSDEGDEEEGEDYDEGDVNMEGDDDVVLVDDGEEGTDYEDEDTEDELGQIGGNGPLPEVRGRSENIGPNGRPFFTLEVTFADKKQLLQALDQYAIKAGVNLHLTKSEPLRVRARCEKGCPFVLFASKDGSNPGLVVKTLNLEHSCSRVFKNPRASVKWLAMYFKQKV